MTLVLSRTHAAHRPTPPAAPWRDLTFPLPGGIPGMLTSDEQRYYAWVAANSPGGRIVELGCFLGGGTACLLAGLAQGRARTGAERACGHVTSYDSFVMPHGGGRHWAPTIREGEWFSDLFEEHVARYATIDGERRLSVRHGWIPEFGRPGDLAYPENEPVDALIIDVAKVWGVHNTILATFLPFVPVGGVLVQQDFKSWLPWLYLHMWQLRDCFEPRHDVIGSTIGFVRTGPDARADLWTPSSFPRARFNDIWNAVEASWSGFGSGQAAFHATLARGRHAITIGLHEHGVECFERAAAELPALCSAPSAAPYRPAIRGIWADALVTMNRGLIKVRAAAGIVDRAARIT